MRAKILFVDDEPDILDILREEYEDLGYQVELASSGYAAIRKLEHEPVGVVVSDYNMADGNGITLANYCADRQIPCIILTGFGENDIRPYLPEGVSIVRKVDCMITGQLQEEIESWLMHSQQPSDHSEPKPA